MEKAPAKITFEWAQGARRRFLCFGNKGGRRRKASLTFPEIPAQAA